MNTNVARLRYHGTGGALLGLVLVNALLSVITLGIYSFWGRTKVRAFHYSHTEMDGDRFAYHGTGRELFVGALKASGVLLVLGVSFGIVSTVLTGRDPNPWVTIALTLLLYFVIGLLLIYAVNSARRYRLSRSSWRGIRFSFHGDAREYFNLIIKGALLTIVTLGFYTPFFQSDRRAFLVNHARFGSEPFQYDGTGRDMFGTWLKALLLSPFTMGFSWVWYAAYKHRYFWNHTTMRGGRFQSTVTFGDLLALQVSNLLLVMFTLGIGATWAITRAQNFYCDALSLHGTMDWASIQQRAQEAGALGEGLAEGMDVDVGIGM